jgi:Cu/Ag efflux protein CusF
MKHPLTLLALGVALLISLPARAADIDWKTVDAALGETAAVSGEVTPVISKLLDSGSDTQETLRGIVANVDERNNKITVRFPSAGTAGDVTGDFKVQDGLIFNAVRYGDEVEFAVETIKGARTIVELRKR